MQELIAKFSVFTQEEFVFLGVCVILFLDLIYFLFHFFKTRSLIKNSEKTVAQVTQVDVLEGPKGQYQQVTLIFKDYSGIEFAPVVENFFKPRQRGERVEIFYRKSDPADVVINDWRSLHMIKFISFFAFVSTAFVGVFLWQSGLLEVPQFILNLL
jgi:hypothetical protein